MNDIQAQLASVLLFLSKIFLLLTFLFFLINIKKIWKNFKEIKNKTWIIIFFIILTSFFLRFFWIPHEHLVIDDGFNDLNIAYTIQKHNTHAICQFVSGDYCNDFFYVTFWPPGYHVTLSYVFNFFYPSQEIAFKLSAFLGVVSVFLAFILGYLWTKKEEIALTGAFIFGLIPPLLKFSGSISQNFFSLFVILVALVFFEIFLKNKDKTTFLLFFFSLFFAVYSRPENAFLIPIFLFIFLMRDNLFEFVKNNKKLAIFSIVFSMISLIPIFTLFFLNSILFPQEGWSPSARETIDYFSNHSLFNLIYFIDYKVNLLAFSLFSFLGMVFVFLKEKRMFLSFFAFFVIFFVFYSSFDVGIFSDEFIRFSLVLYVPLFFFFIKGLFYFFDEINEKFKKILMLALVFVFMISLISTTPFIFEENPNVSTVHLLLSIKEKIPDDAYIVAVNPSVPYSIIRKNAISFRFFKDNYDYFNNKEIYLLEDHWWHPHLNQDLQLFKEFIIKNYNQKAIETIPSKESNFKLGVYQLTKK